MTDVQPHAKRISLYYTGGTSDKEYHLQLEPVGELWMAKAQNGRRGGTLTPRDVTPKPVTYAVALKKYEDKLTEKLKDGYTQDISGAVFQDSPTGGSFTGFVPQLSNQITPEQAELLIEDDGWLMQQKFDGERRSVRATGNDVVGINRQGMAVALPLPLVEAIQSLRTKVFIDGEIVGNKLYAFDLLELGETDLRSCTTQYRYDSLVGLLENLPALARESIAIVRSATSTQAKRELHDRIKAADLEGVLFKRADAIFTAGRPASGGDHLKLKFWESATLQVESHSAAKRSVQVRAFDRDLPISLGSVTIPVNYEDLPPIDSLVEVRYLYAYPAGGDLFQPVYKGPRPDMILSACTMTQLKFKPASQELPPLEEDVDTDQPRQRESAR